ncbi:unnamed protein product [Meloidogyne enterolobii]|uniref:Uncharacterized protein n=1 Tax=Meloidogyne enterolobii TaxID=390850 RepID=A0ACB0ZKE0_MELEN
MSLSNRQNLITKPCKIEQKSQLNQNINKYGVKDLMKINTFQTLDTTLKNSDIKNNTIQAQEQKASTNEVNQRTATITCVGNARQNDEFPLDDFSLLEDDKSNEEINEVEFSSPKSKQFSTVNNQEKEEDLNKLVNSKLIQEDNEAKNTCEEQDEELNVEEECKKSIKFNEAIEDEDILETVDDAEICGEYNDDIFNTKQNLVHKNNTKEINGDKINRNIFEEEEDEIMNNIEREDNDVVVLNTDEEEVKSIKEDDIKVIEETSKNENNDKNINAVENPEVIVVEDDEIIVDFVKINNEESVLDEEENVLIEKEMEKRFQESFIDANLEFGNVSIEEKVAEIVLKHSNMEYAKLASTESTLERINQSMQLIKMDGQEKDIFVECVLKIVQCASVEEKVIVPPLPITNSLEEPMTSTKAAQINALEAELIEPIQTSKQQQQTRRRRQKSTSNTSQKTKLAKTQLKIPQHLPATKTAALPPPPRNLRSSTAKKIIEEEMEAPTTITKTEEEEIKTVAGEELASTVAPIGSRKRKRNVSEFLKPPQTDTNDQQHVEDEGPPAKNLRRSSHSSPSSQTEPKTSTESKKASKQHDSASLTPEILSVKEKAEAPVKIEQEQPIVPIKTPPPPPLQLSTPTLHSHVAATAKLRSSLRRAALASATPSPAVDSVGTNGLFLRPGNHSSSEVIPKEVLLTLWKDIRTHRHSYVFDQPVDEGEVPGYHSAIKKPMDLNTLFQLIESFTIQTFGQFTHHILKIFANAVMYNSTGHHVNTCAKEMLAYALKCIEKIFYNG